MVRQQFLVLSCAGSSPASPANNLWCVCWSGYVEDHDEPQQHKGPPVTRAEAEKRLAWSRKTYPWLISWLEPYI